MWSRGRRNNGGRVGSVYSALVCPKLADGQLFPFPLDLMDYLTRREMVCRRPFLLPVDSPTSKRTIEYQLLTYMNHMGLFARGLS